MDINEILTSKLLIYRYLGRTPKQIRERYVNFLRPKLKKSKWTIDEDLMLIFLMKLFMAMVSAFLNLNIIFYQMLLTSSIK